MNFCLLLVAELCHVTSCLGRGKDVRESEKMSPINWGWEDNSVINNVEDNSVIITHRIKDKLCLDEIRG